MEITLSKGIFKKSLSVFMALLIAMSTMWMGLSVVEFSVGAAYELSATGQCGDNVYWAFDESTGELVISGSGETWDYECPNSGLEIISPFGNWFSGIRRVVIKNGITKIGDYLFLNGGQIEEIEIPNSVLKISTNAFYDEDIGNSPVVIFCNKNSYAETFAKKYNYAYVLLNGTIAENTIGGNLGKNFSWSINKMSGVLEIEGSGKLPEFTGASPAPWNVHSSYITEIKLPEGLLNISNASFGSFRRIRNITIPDSVITIGSSAFGGCNNLESVTIGDSVNTIGSSAFNNCSRLESVTIPDSVTTIGSYAFYNCYNLKSVTIGNSVTTIDSYAFYRCNNLKSIYASDAESWLNINFKYDDLDWDEDVSNPLSKGADLYLDGELVTDVIVPEGITEIKAYSFYNYDNLKSITIPNSVNKIGEYAFYGCGSLESVTIPEGVTEIGAYTFAGCANLESVYLPSTIKFYGYNSIDGMGEYYYSYSSYVFNNCKSLKTVKFNVNENFESAVDKITRYTFNGCSSLREIILPASVKTIEYNSFPSTLEKITILNPDCEINSSCGITYNSEIEGFKGSTAEAFADEKAAYFTDIETIHSHSYKTITDTKATCTEDGLFLERCSCGKENKEVRAKTGHEFKDFEVTLEPTCTSYGEKKAFCKNCDHYEMQRIQPTYHPNRESRAQQNPTCTSYGYTSGVYCPDCETWLSGHVRIDTAGHSFTEKIIDDAHLVSVATVTSPAVYRYDCENCDTIGSATFTHGSALGLGKTSEITASQTTSSIKLTWKPVEEAKGYIIFTWVNGSWEACAIANGTSYNFTNLKSGTKYKLAVVAYGTSNGFISMAPDFTTIETYTKAALPKITVKSDASSIKLTWNKVTGADGYRVYYKSGSSWKTLKTTTGTSYTLKNIKAGTKYTFAVKPYIDTENGKLWSSYKTVVAATTPANPTAKVTSPSKGKLTVTWSAVKGAETYQVYYKTGNGSYKLYKTYSGAKTINFKNLKSGTKYTFAVRAVINTTAGSVRSSYKAVSATVK